jgi:SAM-dependent methyltransferase
VQVRIATERIRNTGLADRVRCIEADFSRLPASVDPADLAYAIESFVHGPAAGVMLDAWARLVRPGGVLVICDDFLRPSTDARDAGGDAAAQVIERFRRGWHVNTLITRDELQARAHAAGFDHESTIDLTASLETGRVRDRVIARLTALAGWLAPRASRIDYLLGGTALQECLARGWIGYDFSVFRRRR